MSAGSPPPRQALPAAVAAWVWYRADAWGVAVVIGITALLLHDAVDAATLALSAAIGAMYWFGYAVNDYFDADTDALDAEKGRRNLFVTHPLVRRAFRPGALVTFGAVTAVFAFHGLLALGAFVAYFLVMWSYSSPPLRLKHVPGVDLLLHAVFAYTYPYLLCVVLPASTWTRFDTFAVAVLFLFSLGGQIEQQLRDHPLDELTGGNFTTAVGPKVASATLRLVTAGAVAVAMLAVVIADPPLALAPYAILMLPTITFRLGLGSAASRPVRVTLAQVSGALMWCAILGISGAGAGGNGLL